MDTFLSSRLSRQLAFLQEKSRKQVLDYFETLYLRRYAPSSLESMVGVIKRLINHLPDERRSVVSADLTQTTSADIDHLLDSLQKKDYSPLTVNHGFSVLGEFFGFLIEHDSMPRQPVSRRRHRVFAPSTLPKPMPEDVLVRFFKVIDSVRNRVIFLSMLRCGLRVSEACALKWDDVDRTAGAIRINNGKGQVDRVVYIAPDLEKSLQIWQARSERAEFLFPSRINPATHIKRKMVYAMMVKYLAIAGIEKFYSPHCLRHTFATQLLNAGVSIEILKELMGHRSVQMTLRYAELYEQTKRRQYDEAMTRIEKRRAV